MREIEERRTMPEANADTPSPAQYPQAQSGEDFRTRLAAVHATMAAAAQRAGRDESEIRLLPVSKTVSEERIRHAVQAGCHQLGDRKSVV